MKIFTCTDHDQFYPVGGASVVLAKNKSAARLLLNAALKKRGLKVTEYHLVEIDASFADAYILADGDY